MEYFSRITYATRMVAAWRDSNKRDSEKKKIHPPVREAVLRAVLWEQAVNDGWDTY